MDTVAKTLILASASSIRAKILKDAGLTFRQVSASIDESAIKSSLRLQGKEAKTVALALADAKARKIAKKNAGAFVIGADQILVCDDVWFDKPTNKADARTQLNALRGRTHELISAVCVVRKNRSVWEHVETASLTVRPFSSAFIEGYIERAGPDISQSVGAYQLEGLGSQLFSKIQGDYFTILGLPLLPLLGFFRWQGFLDD